MSDRPPCPACNGTRVMGAKHPRPCTCCDDGTMRGVTDDTPEERRIAELEARIRELEAESEPLFPPMKCAELNSNSAGLPLMAALDAVAREYHVEFVVCVTAGVESAEDGTDSRAYFINGGTETGPSTVAAEFITAGHYLATAGVAIAEMVRAASDSRGGGR